MAQILEVIPNLDKERVIECLKKVNGNVEQAIDYFFTQNTEFVKVSSIITTPKVIIICLI